MARFPFSSSTLANGRNKLLHSLDPLAAGMAEADPGNLSALLQSGRRTTGRLSDSWPDSQGQQLARQRENAKAVKIPPSSFEVVVGCKDESEQRALFERLSKEGWTCRVLTF